MNLLKLFQRSKTTEETQYDINQMISLGTSGGVHLPPGQAETLPIVLSCIRLISSDIASIEKQVVRQVTTSAGNRFEPQPNSPAQRMLCQSPNDEMSCFNFWESIVTNLLTYGNAYAEIVRRNNGQVGFLFPVESNLVSIQKPTRSSPLYYLILDPRTQRRRAALEPNQILHFRLRSLDGIEGRSTLRYLRETLGILKSTKDYGGRIFAADSGGRIKIEADAAIQQTEEKLKALARSYQSTVLNPMNRMPLMMPPGLKAGRLDIAPEQSHYIDAQNFLAHEIMRAFGIPIGILFPDGSKFANLELQQRSYVGAALKPITEAIAWEVKKKLLIDSQRFDIRIDSLIEPSAKEKAESMRALAEVGAFTTNEIRQQLGLDPIDGGDKRMMATNLVGLDQDGNPEPMSNFKEEHEQVDNNNRESVEDFSALTDAVNHIIDRELAAQRDKADNVTDEWLEEWYEKHKSYCRNKLDSFFPPDIKDILEEIIEEHCERQERNDITANHRMELRNRLIEVLQ